MFTSAKFKFLSYDVCAGYQPSFRCNACLLLTILIICGLFCWSSGAAVCSKDRGKKGHNGNSGPRCKHFHLRDSDQSEDSWGTSLPSKPHYRATPPPPMKTRELPKNPYAEYEAYYNSQV